MTPVLPLKAVSSHVLEVQVGRVRKLTEVIIVIDANGECWRREGQPGNPWQRLV